MRPDWDPPYLSIWKYEFVTVKQRWVSKGWASGLSIHCEDSKMDAATHLWQSKPRHWGQKLRAAHTTLEEGDLLVVQGWLYSSKGNSDGLSRRKLSLVRVFRHQIPHRLWDLHPHGYSDLTRTSPCATWPNNEVDPGLSWCAGPNELLVPLPT